MQAYSCSTPRSTRPHNAVSVDDCGTEGTAVEGVSEMRVKSALLLLAGTVVAVAVPTLFWHGVWFGRVLDDSELERYLNDQHPRQVQHALAQLGERIERKDPAVRSWYPSVAQLAESPLPDLRITTAWVMGQDTDSSLFHSTRLHRLETPSLWFGETRLSL